MVINWGHKLIFTFLVFSGFMSYLVYRCAETRYDLVSKEYYKDELEYQQVIDGTKMAAGLSSPVKVWQNESGITIQFPSEMKERKLSGQAWFYCPVDAGKDKKLDIDISSGAEFLVNNNVLSPGNYIVKINWNQEGKHYYSEQNFTIH